jgi:hypothetical protein
MPFIHLKYKTATSSRPPCGMTLRRNGTLKLGCNFRLSANLE